MAGDESPRTASHGVALRIVLLAMALLCVALMAPALAPRERIDDALAGYRDWVRLAPSENGTDTVSLHAGPLALFVIRLGSLLMAVPALMCLIAMAKPQRCRAILTVLIAAALAAGIGSIWLGRHEGIDVLLYAPLSITALVCAVLLIALFPGPIIEAPDGGASARP